MTNQQYCRNKAQDRVLCLPLGLSPLWPESSDLSRKQSTKIKSFISIVKTSNVFEPKKLIYLREIEDLLKNYIMVCVQGTLPTGLLFYLKSIRRLSLLIIFLENISGLSFHNLFANYILKHILT